MRPEDELETLLDAGHKPAFDFQKTSLIASPIRRPTTSVAVSQQARPQRNKQPRR